MVIILHRLTFPGRNDYRLTTPGTSNEPVEVGWQETLRNMSISPGVKGVNLLML